MSPIKNNKQNEDEDIRGYLNFNQIEKEKEEKNIKKKKEEDNSNQNNYLLERRIAIRLIEIRKKHLYYSYECTNNDRLVSYIYKGTSSTKIDLVFVIILI